MISGAHLRHCHVERERFSLNKERERDCLIIQFSICLCSFVERERFLICKTEILRERDFLRERFSFNIHVLRERESFSLLCINSSPALRFGQCFRDEVCH